MKGGFAQFTAKHLVITSNVSPYSWYRKVMQVPERKDSFERRLTNIVEFTNAGFIIRKVDAPPFELDWRHFLPETAEHLRGCSHFRGPNGFAK